ncbi:alpha-mannosidase, partial [Mycobacterium tuberculosis 02_1987]
PEGPPPGRARIFQTPTTGPPPFGLRAFFAGGRRIWGGARIPGGAARSSPTRCLRWRRDGHRASCRRSARCCTSSRPTRCSWARSRRPATRWQPAARGRSNPPRWRCDWCKRQEPTPRSPSAASWAR